MRNLILTLLLFFIFFGCTKKEAVEDYQPVQIPCNLSKDLDTLKQHIEGTWQWLEEKRVNRIDRVFDYLTPQNQGYTLTLKLGNDTARFFRNNQPDSVYIYKILIEKEITNYPEDNNPVLALYRIRDGLRSSYVPLKICPGYMLLQYQYVSSVVGECIWKKQ